MNAGELLFARMRMTDFLAGKGPAKWDLREPERVQRQVADGFRAYLRKGAPAPEAVPVDWVFTLPDEMPETAAASVERLPEDAIIPFTLTAQRAMQYLKDMQPERRLPGLAHRLASTTHAERARMRRAAAAVEDPVGRLASPEWLSVDGIAAIASVYPELYADAMMAIGDAVSELKRPLRAREEAALGRLSGVAAKAKASLVGQDQSQQGSDQQQRPRGKAPAEPDLKPGSQRLTERPR